MDNFLAFVEYKCVYAGGRTDEHESISDSSERINDEPRERANARAVLVASLRVAPRFNSRKSDREAREDSNAYLKT